MTTTSPLVIVPSSSASSAARSRSKTLAVPSNTSESKPADLTTAPSGASDPCRIVMPPVGWIGLFIARNTLPSGSGGSMWARFSAMVSPVTVRQSPCSRPASSSAFMTTGTPPISSTCFITWRPNGLTSARCGTFCPMRVKSASVSLTPASDAIASRCRTALVDPPNAITTAMAFSNASIVSMSLVVIPRRSISTTASPERRAYSSRRESIATGDALPGSDMPSASAADAMVLAVYIPPHAPSPGQIARSMMSTSSRDIRPRAQAPTASKASMIVTSFSLPSVSFATPGMIEPL
ncbi:hypothetical protein [Mycobacterium gallinarum]|uniref:hypothetical protein n=1 Tax=Mycobacterium gallinarum TaxID=39689 RepID=UPI0013CF534A|nr:hypothetical protein [Mycobacterium gallinarum]